MGLKTSWLGLFFVRSVVPQSFVAFGHQCVKSMRWDTDNYVGLENFLRNGAVCLVSSLVKDDCLISTGLRDLATNLSTLFHGYTRV